MQGMTCAALLPGIMRKANSGHARSAGAGAGDWGYTQGGPVMDASLPTVRIRGNELFNNVQVKKK